jgi:hypothetical protein
MPRKLLFFIFSVSYIAQLFAQSDSLSIGQWRSYLSHQRAKSVTQSREKVIIGTDYALMYIDKEDNTIEYQSKIEGLSDAGMQLVKYNKFSDILLVVYDNSNIDLIYKDGSIKNLRDILDNLNIIGDKTVYDAYIQDAKMAYLACGFGILKLDMSKGEFVFTTFTTGKTRGITLWNDVLYAATEQGVYSFPSKDNKLNPADFSNWKPFNIKPTKDSVFRSRVVNVFQNKLYYDVNDSLFVFDGTKHRKLQYWARSYYSFLSSEGKNLLIGSWKVQPGDYNWGGKVFYLNDKDELKEMWSYDGCIVDPYYGIEEENGKIWLADVERGIKTFANTATACKLLVSNSPFTNNVQQMELDKGNIWVASGGYTPAGSYNESPEGFYHYIDGKWGVTNRTNDDIMQNGYLYTIHSITSLAINEATNKRFVGSFWGGLLEADEKGKVIKHYTSKNSTLQTAIGDNDATRVGGIAFDKKGTLWVSNNSAPRPFSALTTDGKWHVMGSDYPNAQIYRVFIDPVTNYKWFVIGKGNPSIIVYDEGKNIDDESDDRSIVLNTTNTQLPGSRVNWIAPDLDGKMWVATDDGVIWFACGASIFDKETKSNICNGSLPTTVVDGIPEYLLKYNNVTTIAVDGANRKWFGTSSGLFIQSPDGKTQIAYFDKNNSPLFDNNIIDIAINNKTGEVFIATNKGIQSFKTEALLGSDVHGEVIVYPNPIRPEYDGLIAIKGLAQDANVKITDVNGRLVYETTALGGQAVWDGKDYNGNKVQTGVYLVFSAFTNDVDYPNEAVTKLMIIR